MWPESLVAGQLEEPQDEYGELSLQHLDFHFGNWVFDAFTADETGTKEHDLMPPLVMIDFDYVKAATKEATDQARDQSLTSMLRLTRENLRDLAMINRKNSEGLPEEDPEKNPKIDVDLRTILTITYHVPNPILRLRRWMGMALNAIRDRDGEYYATKLEITDGTEGDDAIRQLVRRLILEPNEEKQMT
ncbi:hypothetical protein PFICI_02777 [Pestalotiopsis fici W106-1]|uniref:Uncharacterized protein n=1 Tax=Pestalotiopsis fici (strain W106-1 / CGMCC3.15140) TaxID=1229662 RepID=W3XH63_PESFW|nr:uncharacterized protein PFICI_02777 [Pestalotiopsis fici W106-1]ETS84752.1 hypothetical protein PFICI_02777 [Pestalotiopsis fici W106-1]